MNPNFEASREKVLSKIQCDLQEKSCVKGTVLFVSDSKIVLYQSFFLEITLKSDALCLRANSTLSGLTFTWKFNAKKENSKVDCLRAILIRLVVKEYLFTSILAAWHPSSAFDGDGGRVITSAFRIVRFDSKKR